MGYVGCVIEACDFIEEKVTYEKLVPMLTYCYIFKEVGAVKGYRFQSTVAITYSKYCYAA